MPANKRKVVVVIGLGLLLSLCFFVGIYEEREWRELRLFLKHRPSSKVLFYAPRHEADPSNIPGKEGYLSPDQEKEERAYIEFVQEHGGYRRSIGIF